MIGLPRAARGSFPYPARTVAELDAERSANTCNLCKLKRTTACAFWGCPNLKVA